MRHSAPFVAAKVSVASVESAHDHHVIEIVGALQPYAPPFAPAALYDTQTERVEAVQLHKLVCSSEESFTFHTFPPQHVSSAIIGGTFVYRPWWTPEQLEIVLDTSLPWSRERYPDDGSHTHCMLTWEAISAYAEPTEGYRCGRHTWITVDAYEKFIRGDLYRCRAKA